MAVLTTLFFIWGFMTVMNDVLIPHLKAVFTLSWWQSMLVQFCFFGAYFLGSLFYYLISRGGEELEALAEAGLKFQVVPGVSAAEGCAAYAGIPLTLRGVAQAVLLTTGHTRDDGTPTIGEYQPGQTLALYMGVAQYAEIAEALVAKGYARETPVAVIESGTTDRQRVVRTGLGRLAAAAAALHIQPPALLIVGETTRYAERYSWFAPSKIEYFADESPGESADVSYRQSTNKAAP